MDKYFTLMVIPEREKGVKSIRVPRIIFHALTFFVVAFVALLGILGYDYWKILKQVYENKHLTIENQQLKEQIQLFQMKINSLTDDIERIHIFEKKLRIITGFEEHDTTRNLIPGDDETVLKDKKGDEQSFHYNEVFEKLNLKDSLEENRDYNELKDLYEQKIATHFGLQTSYVYTKEWNELTKQSFRLASQYAEFDFKFNIVKNFVEKLEVDIHKLDQHLLDKDSFLNSTPSLLPTKGWITSYYGPRKSHVSKRIKMHEGIDIGAKSGTPIIAPADGVVTFSGVKPGFGKFVQLDHGYGVETIYGHAKTLYVRKGQKIKRGHSIAAVGNTGYSTGPHVHYEVRVNGTPVDPLFYILD